MGDMKSSSGKKQPVLLGSRSKVGMSYLFLFPFDIYHNSGDDLFEVRYQGDKVRIYPPFANDDEDAPNLRQVTLKHVPRQPQSTPPHIAAPMLNDIELNLTRWQDMRRGDALRVDIFGSDVAAKPAISFVNCFLNVVRMLTLQWWITRDHRPDRSYLRNSFEINEHGERLQGVISHAKKYGGFHVEKEMTRELFESAALAASRELDAPLAFLTLCDAIYHHGVSDTRRSIIDAAITTELLLAEEVPRFVADGGGDPQAASKRIDAMEFSDRIDRGMKELLGESFAEEQPQNAEWLEALWIARNNVAHGKSPVIVQGGCQRTPDPEDYTAMTSAVIELIIWLQQFGDFRPR